MAISSVKAVITEDNTGVSSIVRTLVTEQGILLNVTEYILHLDAGGASRSVQNTFRQATTLFLEYVEANMDYYGSPKDLFSSFSKRLLSGTIGNDGLDPSGLYWLPRSNSSANRLVHALTKFTDWVAINNGTERLNPITKATPHEQRLNYAAWFRRNQNDFLGHIKNTTISEAAKQAREIKIPRAVIPISDAVSFPEELFPNFFYNGIGAAKDPRVAMRDQLITLLMHGGGLRVSEAVIPWIADISNHPLYPGSTLIRVYNEVDGKAPHGWKGRNGNQSRKSYLKEEFGRIPRKYEIGTQHVGWKNKRPDSSDGYIEVFWFPSDLGILFNALWQKYLRYRAMLKCHHPYAFVSFSKRYLGIPLSVDAFCSNYEAGLRRIDLEPSKPNGLDPHGHRHSYGRRLERNNIPPLARMKCLHHKSEKSQQIYTSKSNDEVSKILTEATTSLNSGVAHEQDQSWAHFLERGFEDIDQGGLFSGKTPLLEK